VSTWFGLCDACVHQRLVGNTRGSQFSLCGLARTDARFPKYPPMPVLRCDGIERAAATPAVAAGPDPADGGDDGAR
jgi:hypothetical protein